MSSCRATNAKGTAAEWCEWTMRYGGNAGRVKVARMIERAVAS